MDNKIRYNDFGCFLAKHFPFKVQKISVNAGFTCPNRDGSKGYGGCTYCNNQTFNPEYCRTEKSVRQQLEEGKEFFSRKYPEMKYLAYFQAYTNTYAELESLKAGIESTNDVTLKRINRGHDFACTVDAVKRTVARGIMTGGHVILGLPGENREMIIRQAKDISSLPLTTLKMHQLQLIKGTRMAREYEESPGDFHLYTADEYIDLVLDYIEHLRPELVLERFISQSPRELLIAPDWGLKNHEFTAKLKKRMQERDSYQGKK